MNLGYSLFEPEPSKNFKSSVELNKKLDSMKKEHRKTCEFSSTLMTNDGNKTVRCGTCGYYFIRDEILNDGHPLFNSHKSTE
jgi:hypothetical protein